MNGQKSECPAKSEIDPKTKKPKKRKKIEMTGASGALPIWANYMKQALESSPPTEFPKSALLKEVRVDRHSGFEASSHCPESQTQIEMVKKEGFPGETKCEAFPLPFDKEVKL
jgi:membrane carboxypeptidase/penicillin-binding protein